MKYTEETAKDIWELTKTYPLRQIATILNIPSSWGVRNILRRFNYPTIRGRRETGNFSHLSKEELGYFAGILDGEGCIYKGRILITNTSRELMEWLINRIGGRYMQKKPVENHKITYAWSLRVSDTRTLLKLVHPLLLIKFHK